MVKKINNYFFDSDTVHISDVLWFYGLLGIVGILAVTVIIPMWVQTIINGGF